MVEVSCNFTVSVNSLSVNSIEQAGSYFRHFLGLQRRLRFKKRGMSWFVHKANPLLALRRLKLNGEWEA